MRWIPVSRRRDSAVLEPNLNPYFVAGQSGFERNVGLFMAVMIGIGAIMSPGVFALPSEVAGSIGRPASGRPMA